jgi:hypothetical protein
MTYPDLSADLKMKILRTVEAQSVPTRRAEMLRSVGINAVAVFATVCLFHYQGGVLTSGRTPELVFGTSTGSLVLAALGFEILMGRNGTMLGRSRLCLIVSAILLPLALLVWKVQISSYFPHALDQWSTCRDYSCLLFGVELGSFPLIGALYTRRGTDPIHPNITGLAIGVAVGLGVAVLLDLGCPVACLSHLLLGHILPIGILAAAGFTVGRKLLST